MDYKKIGEFIQQRRKEIGLTQKQLGEKLNITDKAVSKWETGQGCPDVSLLGELSEALNVGIGEILNGEFNETLKDNSEFIKNAVDYSKRVTEDNIYDKIRKILYVILVLITIYMTFMGIRQFIYLSGGVEFKSNMYDDVHLEFNKLKDKVEIIKENGYLKYRSSNSDYSFDYAESLEYLVLQLENSKLLDSNTVEIKNSELLNSRLLSDEVNIANMFSLTYLMLVDKENAKYYDLAHSDLFFNSESYYVVDSEGNPDWSSLYKYNGISYYYSAELYDYDKIVDNEKTINDYYKELELSLTKLNKTLDIVIEVGENNENN